jgi:hypothetical protein
MAAVDWTALTDGLDALTLLRGVTGAEPRPNGGGAFVYGFRSAAAAAGAAGWVTDQADFAPITPPASGGGGSVRGCMKRGLSIISTGFAPMLFIGLQAGGPLPSVLDEGYVLGLEDTAPHRVVLRKGRIVDGCPSATSDNSLMRSLTTEAINTYWHLRLDMVVNPSGDVVLTVYRNDLDLNLCTAPVWEKLPMDGSNGADSNEFIDDVLGAASGSVPFASGYVGFACQVAAQAKRVYFDQLVIGRQNP